MLPAALIQILSSSPGTLGGEVCFANTRVPVRILFDHVNRGIPVDIFLEDYPSIPLSWAMQVLNWERDLALESLAQSSNAFVTA